MSIIGRTSVFTTASTRIFTAILLVGFLPGVSATCWIDESSNREFCDGLSPAARVGIGIGFFLLFMAVVFGLVGYRRRRFARSNLAYINQTGNPNAYGNSYGYGGGPPPFGPQYPPQAHGSPYGYDPATGFAPPASSPPQYYAPPPGAPPVRSPK